MREEYFFQKKLLFFYVIFDTWKQYRVIYKQV